MNYSLIGDLVGDIKSILDIGAHFGLFTLGMKEVYPNSKFYMIEANKECEDRLKKIDFDEYTICLLSDEKKEVEYFMNKNDLTSTGNSYYREITEHFSDENLIKVNCIANTLDELFPNTQIDFIKLDTQGSEIDILKGGKKLIESTKYILVECSVEEYNLNAPMIDDVRKYMDEIGFDEFSTIESHVINGKLTQQDLLFIKREDE
jgi:FkbM family methyltransferase